MSTQALKAATGAAKAPQTLVQMLAKDNFKNQLALALPKHLTADRMVRIAMTEIRKVPKLATCDQASFFGAVMQCAQLGLEPGGSLGHAWLIPFENRKKHITEVQLVIGYRGMLDIARRSGQIVSISARIVRANDDFHYAYGLNEDLYHVPCESGEPGEVTHVYAVARLKGGGIQFEVLSRGEIERVRAQSKSQNYGPWSTHFEDMAKKTAIRRIFKYLPVSIEMQTAVSVDEKAEAGTDMDLINNYEPINYEEIQPENSTETETETETVQETVYVPPEQTNSEE